MKKNDKEKVKIRTFSTQNYHWADGIAEKLIKQGSKSTHFICAAGIAPSGTIHIGHFREVITVDLVVRVLKKRNKKARFIFFWDDFDRFRKIPKNVPKHGVLENFLFFPLSLIPDPYSCHSNYAEHFEKEFENSLRITGINPEIISQYKNYTSCKYAKEIRFVLESKKKIKDILNRYRKEPLPTEWWPVQIYCETCKKDTTKILEWDGNFVLKYECSCGNKGCVDFSKKGIVKLPWRIDWPMRWHYAKIDFEPGGKEHSTPGGSIDTARDIIIEVYKEKPPLYMTYDFIIVKGMGGKMSSSTGNVITLQKCLEIYEPQIIRYLFASTRPNTEFSISFDQDVIKIYADYDLLEERYFTNQLDNKHRRIFELSQIDTSKPVKVFAPSFRQLVELVQLKTENEILEFFEEKIKNEADKKRTLHRIKLAKNWLKYAPEHFKFKIQKNVKKEIKERLSKEEVTALKKFSELGKELDSEDSIMEKIKEICVEYEIKPKNFFEAAYLIILGKKNGPRLSTLLLLEKEKILKLLRDL